MSTDAQPAPEAEPQDAAEGEAEPAAQEGYFGFTLRELLLAGTWLVMFALSFVPGILSIAPYGAYTASVGAYWPGSLWQQSIGWIVPIGLPTVAVFLLILRRFSPQGIRRVGSLGIDQVASVTAVFAALAWAQLAWADYTIMPVLPDFQLPWLVTVELLGALALVVFTVGAPLVPGLKEDFQGRPEVIGHRNASTVRKVVARPRPVKPESQTSEPQNGASEEPVGDTSSSAWTQQAAAWAPTAADSTETTVFGAELGTTTPFSDVAAPTEVVDTGARTEAFDGVPPQAASSPDTAAAQQPFWVLAPTERDVVDEQDKPLFRIGPTAWALVIEDRGGAYLIRHDDGRVGFLHDISDVTKG